MAKGICCNKKCTNRLVDLDVRSDRTVCVCCGEVSINTAAEARYRELPTLDPIKPSAPEADPAQAFKSDAGKVRFELLEDGCPNALLMIAKVLTWAVEVKGYHPHSWKEVPDAIRRYKAALARHRNAIARGEVLDPESGYPHWAHVACCTLFLLELENFNE